MTRNEVEISELDDVTSDDDAPRTRRHGDTRRLRVDPLSDSDATQTETQDENLIIFPFSSESPKPRRRRNRRKKAKKVSVVRATAALVKKLRAEKMGEDSDFEYMFPSQNVEPSECTVAERSEPPQPAPKIALRSMLQKSKIEQSPGAVDVPRLTVRDPPGRTARVVGPKVPTLVEATWPSKVVHVADYYNPSDISFPYLQTRGMCSCLNLTDCWLKTCTNASVGVFCDVYCCPWSGFCSNGTRQSSSVRLMRFSGTDDLAVQATERINEGVVIGEYLGKLTYEPSDKAKREPIEGYRLHFHKDRDTWGAMDVCVNSIEYATLMRFVNHSCTPNAVFNEVGNGYRRTITVVTTRVILAGEEILCDYGPEPWFDCRCAMYETERTRLQGLKE